MKMDIKNEVLLALSDGFGILEELAEQRLQSAFDLQLEIAELQAKLLAMDQVPETPPEASEGIDGQMCMSEGPGGNSGVTEPSEPPETPPEEPIYTVDNLLYDLKVTERNRFKDEFAKVKTSIPSDHSGARYSEMETWSAITSLLERLANGDSINHVALKTLVKLTNNAIG